MKRLRLRHLVLPIIIAAGAWALWPSAQATSTGAGSTRVSRNRDAKYVIRVAPSCYLPGMMPHNVGKPLQGLDLVAEDFERMYPDTRVEFVGVPGVREWLVTQLSAGTAPDILNVNVEDVWQDTHKGWYVALDPYFERPNPFITQGPGTKRWADQFKYEAVTQGTMAPDGKRYCLSYDMVETGIFYNKDIFKKVGIGEPRDWQEWMDGCEKIRQAGYVPFLSNSNAVSDWGVDLIFDQLYHDLLPLLNLRTDVNAGPYLANYLDWDEIAFLFKKGFFTHEDPRYAELWRIVRDWRKHMVQDIGSTDFLKMFITQRGAMMWSASWHVPKLALDPEVKFDWGVFYVPGITKSTSKYASGRGMVVIGGSAVQFVVTNVAFNDTRDQATSEKLKRCIAFLQFMCVPQNSDRVVNELWWFLPNIKGVEPHPQLMPFHEFLQRPYSMTKWTFTFDLRFTEIQNRMLGLYMDDGISRDEMIAWMEKNISESVATITRRKKLDFAEFDRIWGERKHLRQTMDDLPASAR
jgi:raffinose/stachyose/melibiose transport system substrate-binding protein